MKKFFALLLTLVMVLSLVACGQSAPAGDDGADAPAGDEVVSDMGEAVDRAEYGIPSQYTKVKIFNGTYGFGDAEIVSAMTDDESAFYIQFVCFDEAQILEGTVANGIAMVTFDLTGFVSGDAQLIYDDTLASTELWCPLTGEAAPAVDPVARADYEIPETYTKVKIFNGTYGFGDAEIVAAFTDAEDAFFLTFTCFDELQVVEGTIANGIAMVTYDKTGFMAADAQLICDDAFAAAEPWAPLQ